VIELCPFLTNYVIRYLVDFVGHVFKENISLEINESTYGKAKDVKQ